MTDAVTRGEASIPRPGVGRRVFLQGLGVLLVGGALLVPEQARQLALSSAAAHGLALPSALLAPSVPALKRSTFAGLLHTTFRIEEQAGSGVDAQLWRVRDLLSKTAVSAESGRPQDTEHCFSLVFRAAGGSRLDQAVYDVSHAQLGGLALLLVPLMSDPDAHFYEAVVNSPPM